MGSEKPLLELHRFKIELALTVGNYEAVLELAEKALTIYEGAKEKIWSLKIYTFDIISFAMYSSLKVENFPLFDNLDAKQLALEVKEKIAVESKLLEKCVHSLY